eukprot:715114-Prorocentrum_minimum.AAC.1
MLMTAYYTNIQQHTSSIGIGYFWSLCCPIFSRWTNQMQEARVYSNNGPIRFPRQAPPWPPRCTATQDDIPIMQDDIPIMQRFLATHAPQTIGGRTEFSSGQMTP